jgi:hypothetical protein
MWLEGEHRNLGKKTTKETQREREKNDVASTGLRRKKEQ